MTRRSFSICITVFVLLTLLLTGGNGVLAQTAGAQSPVGNAFTYQGQLKKNNAPVTDNCLMAFRLYDQASGGSQIGSPITTTVPITNGLFTVALDFGSTPFTGEARWLGITVRCTADSAYVDLSRQALTATPFALYSTSTGALQGRSVANASPATNQVLKWNGSAWVPANDETSGGPGNSWSLTGNTGTNPLANFLGTTDNAALNLRVNNDVALQLIPNAASPNIIGGYNSNNVTPGAAGATIGGGGSITNPNRVLTHFGTVGGGQGNTVGGIEATVGGGFGNTASGQNATVSGGTINTAYGEFAAIAGGDHNAAGLVASVGGGNYNHAAGYYSSIAGGDANTAAGNHTFIGGGLTNFAGGHFSTIGGGESISVTGFAATVAGGSRITVTGDYATVGGGANNIASGYASVIDGGGGFNYSGDGHPVTNTASGAWSVIGGGAGNTASGGVATVGGGTRNTGEGGYSTIGGGWNNGASGWSATVGGGQVNTASGFAATIGGGQVNTASGDWATVDGGQRNSAGGLASSIGGGQFNSATGLTSTIGGGEHVSITGRAATVAGGSWITVTGDYATVGGGANNLASGHAAFIGGGGGFYYGIPVTNTASGDWSVIGGGSDNTASNRATTVGGGRYNTASGDHATVSGGFYNVVSGTFATAGGGWINAASGDYATVGGGWNNRATGESATVPGGAQNTAGGDYSFSAGSQAWTASSAAGSFVWSDSNPYLTRSWGPNEFVARATGGFWFISGIDASGNIASGMRLAGGSSAWSPLSDRNAKTHYSAVDGRDVLARLAAIPIQTWNYKAQDPAIRHIGPVAQDFYAAFKVGEDDKFISTVDADGVALASIQGLYQIVQEKDTEISTLKSQMSKQQTELDEMKVQLSALEAQVNGGASSVAPAFNNWALTVIASIGLMLGVVIIRRGGAVRRQSRSIGG